VAKRLSFNGPKFPSSQHTTTLRQDFNSSIDPDILRSFAVIWLSAAPSHYRQQSANSCTISIRGRDEEIRMRLVHLGIQDEEPARPLTNPLHQAERSLVHFNNS